MKSPLWNLLLLVLLLIAIAAPFSALAMLMLFTFFAVLTWTFWTLVRSFFSSDAT